MPETQPTIVLVHRALIDGSSWSGVVAPANPPRGLAADDAYLTSAFAHVDDLPAEPVTAATQRPIAAAHAVGRRS